MLISFELALKKQLITHTDTFLAADFIFNLDEMKGNLDL